MQTNAELKSKALDGKIDSLLQAIRVAVDEINITKESEVLDPERTLVTMDSIIKNTPATNTYIGLMDGRCFAISKRGIYPDFNAREK